MSPATRAKLDRLNARIAALQLERDAILAAEAAALGFTPCGDCFDGWCTMNCSSAPLFIKVEP